MKYAAVLLASVLSCATLYSAQGQAATLAASDDSFEDRVELSWTISIPAGQFFRIERDGAVLSIQSRTETSFADVSGDPATTYTYCVIPSDAQGNDGTPACDTGRRIIFSSANVDATDRTLEDRVSISWSDRSEIEAGYRIYRTTVAGSDSTLLATLAANREVYNDPLAVVGTAYRYCLVAFDSNGYASAPACDEGTRGAVMPPAAVVASDGQFNDRVRVTWVDQTSEETGYTVYRGGALIGSVGVDGQLFDDLTAATEVDYDYCVTATINGIESVNVCDRGRRGGLTPPQSVLATDLTFDDRVDLSWSDVAESEDGFLVSRLRDGVIDTVFAALGKDAESFSDASAEQSSVYDYCVQSFSDAGAPDRSVSVPVCDNGARAAVLAPTAVAASERTYEDRSEITWTNPSTTAMLFNIYRDNVLVDNVPGNETRFGDTQIASGTDYNYCVSAMTVTGANASLQASVAEMIRSMRPTAGAHEDDGVQLVRDPQAVLLAFEQLAAASVSTNSSPLRTVDASAAGLAASATSAAAGDIVESAQLCDTGSRLLEAPSQVEATFEEFEDHVEVSWTDNSTVERGHRVYRKGPADPQPVLVGSANTGKTTFGDYRGVPGVTYTYSVRAFDLRGPGGESAPDSDTGGRKLEEPTAFIAASGDSETQVPLTWKDNSRAETGYELKRDGLVLGVTAADEISYTDTTPIPGVLHEYMLTAVDTLGRSKSVTLEAGTVVRAPGSFNASDTYSDRVVVAWEDNTVVGTSYELSRDGTPLAFLQAGSTQYEDLTVATGATYTYCATTVADLGFQVSNSVTVCDNGTTAIAATAEELQRVAMSATQAENFLRAFPVPIDISGTAAVIGSPYEDPRPNDPNDVRDGAAFILEQDPQTLQWSTVATFLSESKTSPRGDSYGQSVSISGNTIVVGAYRTGTPACTLPSYLCSYDDGPGSMSVIVRNENTGEWNLSQTITPTLVGTGDTRTEKQQLGKVVAVDGNTLFATIKHLLGPTLYVYERASEADPFVKVQEIDYDVDYGNSPASISIAGDVAITGGYHTSIYRRSPGSGQWNLETKLTATSGGLQGGSPAIAGDFAFARGQTSVEDVVYVYERNPATGLWGAPVSGAPGTSDPTYAIAAPEVDDYVGGGEDFGASLAASGGLLAVGSHGFGSCPGQCDVPGRVYLYNLNPISGIWEPVYDAGPDGRPQLRIFEPDPDEIYVGRTVAASDDKIMYTAETKGTSAGIAESRVVHISTRPAGNLLQPPSAVAATDGVFQARVQVQWNDDEPNEDGYRVFRDGNLVAELAANSESYSDFDIAPGKLAAYCVVTFRNDLVDAPQSCDFGWRPPDGAISGSVRAPQTGTQQLAVSNREYATPESGLIESAAVLSAGSEQTEDSASGPTFASIAAASLFAEASAAAAGDSVLICLAPDPDRGLLFDGTGGWVEINGFRRLPGEFTVEFWAKRANADNNGQVLFAIGDSASTQLVTARFTAGGAFRFSVGAVDLDYADGAQSGWHHWALTLAATGTRQIVRDGVVVQSDAGPASVVVSGPLVLGSDFGRGDFLAGSLDEVRIWDEVRTVTQIGAVKDQSLGGNETGLLGYWSMNQGSGVAIGDGTGFGRHGLLRDGAYWSANGAIRSCTLADTQGKYTLDAIRYNESTIFTVTPNQEERVFNPPASEITLNTQNPVENQVDFIDVTQLGAGGRVLFDGTDCPVPDVDILVDGVPRSTTQRDGSFLASLSPRPDEAYRFTPRKVNPDDASDAHAFLPSSTVRIVDRALMDLDFTDTKTRPLNAFFGGSCELVSNLGTITIEVSTENGCFKQQFDVSGEVDIDLPPQKYLVQVKDVQTGDTNLRADMIQYFDELGVQEIDLTNAADTLDLTYHAPISMTITGFPAPPVGQCPVYTSAEGGTLPVVPLLRQGASYNVTMNVSEDYGQGRVCPVNFGTVAVYDAVADSANIKRVYEIEDGKVQHRTLAATPNVFKGASVGGIDRSYQKSFTGVAEVPGRDPLVKTDWVIVEGVRARTAEFVSATSDPFPLLIVHDPPGTNSSAYLEEGTSQCVTMSNMVVLGGAGGASFDVTLGVELEIGVVVSTESGGGFKATGKTVFGGSDSEKSGIEICATTTEKFSTSGDIGWSGEDLFMGVALNLIFARADELDVDQCKVAVTEKLAADLDTENAFETIYTYGSTHIRDSLIPDLAELIELSGGDPTVSGDPDGDGTEETIRLSSALENWKAQLANNERLKAQALEGTVVNRSFSAGADYEYSHSDATKRTSTETSKFYIKSENSLGGTVKLLGYDQTFQVIYEFNYELVNETGASTDTTVTTGYTLSDGDTGDFFSVDVGTDPRYGTPVFGTVSGRSSNPWEGNTQRRDWPLLSASPPVQYNVPPDENARVTLNLTNASESGEPREYVLGVVRTSNPGSANIAANGLALVGTYLVEAGESQEVEITVGRGPSRYNYEDLEVIAYPQPEFEIWQADTRQQFVMSDTARFSVFFEAPCSDISILRPKQLWSVNKSNIADSLEVILRNFDLSGSDIFDVSRIGFQYRRVGTPDWFPAGSISVNRSGGVESDSLDASVRSWVARWFPQADGEYELRAFTECGGGKSVFSDVVPGVVDTKAPKPLGAPTPTDEVLKFGGLIAATFDEPVACASIVTTGVNTNAALTYLDGPLAGTTLAGFEAVCDGKTVVFNPPDGFDWSPAEGRIVQASLGGVADIYGNPVDEPVRWQFTVRRSAFAWAPANLAVEVPRGTNKKVEATLVNGRAQPADYRAPATIQLLPENGGAAIPLAVTNNEGTVVPQGEHKISFTIPDSLLPGRYTSTLDATRYENDVAMEQTPLYITADVVCRAPDWTVEPAAFEQSMTLAARLVVDGAASADVGDIVVALVDGDVRGVAPVSEPAPGVFLVQMLIYGNGQGDLVKFQVWDSDRCQLYRETNKAFLFRSGQILGTFSSPIELEAPPQAVPQAVDLAAGWTWFSTNRVATDASVNSVLAGVIASPGDLVKSQTAYAQYDATAGWVGPLAEIQNGAGYFAKLQQSNRLLQSATATDPTTPIALNDGWTWVGYLPTATLETNVALASLTPASGDLIKSQFGFAEFADRIGWVGSLTSMQPGLGYLVYSDAAGTLVYPAAGGAESGQNAAVHTSVTTSVTSAENSLVDSDVLNTRLDSVQDAAEAAPMDSLRTWSIAPKDYPETMTIVAEIRRDGVVVNDPELQIGLFAGDEFRGSGRILHVPAADRYLAFIIVYGDDSQGEPLEVRFLDSASGAIEVANQHTTFAPNARVGSIGDAVVFEATTVVPPTEYALDYNYPNPFRGETAIRFGLPEDGPVQLEVFDVIGRRVAVLMHEEKVPAGWHVVTFDGSELASGAYFCRIKAGEFRAVQKMVVLK